MSEVFRSDESRKRTPSCARLRTSLSFSTGSRETGQDPEVSGVYSSQWRRSATAIARLIGFEALSDGSTASAVTDALQSPSIRPYGSVVQNNPAFQIID
ncbi:unnamed protein product [Penicillium pancosmium]